LIGSYHTELPEYVSQRLINHLDPSFQDDPDAREYVADVSSALTWDYLACFYNHCAKVLVPSDYTKRQVADRLRSPLAIFPRGVDTALFDPTRRQRADSKVRLLFVGRLAVEKNLDWLVRFGQHHPEHELVIVGDGPEREALQAALPQAIFTGFLRGEALAQAYADADLFAFPSHTETFGNVVLEAQASGLPAVVSDRGGPAEIIEPQVSGLVAGEYETFEANLQALAGDRARRAAFGKAARQRAQQRSWSGVFEGLLHQYRSVEYPYRRKLFLKVLRTLKESDSPVAVGLVSFWKQFGKRRAQQEAQRSPLMIASRLAVLDSQRTDQRP
jgi:glycosyltransferase involved in cell wall biosynthesis